MIIDCRSHSIQHDEFVQLVLCRHHMWSWVRVNVPTKEKLSGGFILKTFGRL